MKVVCDNCRAVYKVPDAKLTKPVNKATCRGCGHRMLIPKPKPDADPEERTLVTAVPPTPAPTGQRTDGPATKSIEADEPDATLPGQPPGSPPWSGASKSSKDMSVFPGTPLPAARKHNTGGAMATTVTAPVPDGPSTVPAALPPKQPNPPTPAPPPARPAFDPSGDLAWAMLGTLVALVGAFTLGTQAFFDDERWRLGLQAVGLMMAVSGGMTTLLVLFSGGRGTRPARPVLSILFSSVFGVAFGALAASSTWATLTYAQDINFEFGSARVSPKPVPDLPAPSDDGDAVADAADDADALSAQGAGDDEEGTEEALDETDEGAADEAPAETTSTPRPSPSPSPRPSSSPSPSPSPSPSSAPAPAPAPAPPPAPAPAPAPSGVPMDVVEVMLYNNLGIKKCFVPLFKAGNVPPRVDLRFTIQPTGQVSDARVSQSQYSGTEFEGCLRTAVKAVAFPPFSGSAQTLTFPFVLQ